MSQENITTKFSVDISELKKGISDASKNIKLANAQFKAASAGMDDWKNSTDGLQAKLKQLHTVLDNEVKKLELKKKELQEVEKAEKENAKRAEELKKKLQELADSGVAKTSEEYRKYAKALSDVEKEQAANRKTADDLKIEILNQQATVNKTTKEMRNYKKRLDEVKSSSKNLDDVTDDVSNNFENVGKSAKDTAKDLDELKDGFTVLKGAAADLIAEGVQKLIGGFKDIGKELIDNEKALSNFQAKTGASAGEMKKYSKVINELYGDNMGESLADVADSMALVVQTSKEVDPSKIKDLTKNALLLRDTFDFDVNESMRAANMLMDQFGLSGQEAFNLIAQGAQSGLNKNGDLLDVINEYSVHYKQLGFSAEQFFNSLVNGASEGTFSVDKLGDAMKEFGIRAKDTAASTTEGFELIGLNADEMRNKFVVGGETAKNATKETINALFNLNDEVKRNQAGVDLFGTMWEDLGEDAIRSLANVNGGISTTGNALKQIDNNRLKDLGAQFEAIGRDINTDLVYPIGKELMPVVKDIIKSVIPSLKTGIKFLIDHIKPLGSAVVGLGTAWGAFKVAQKASNVITTVTTTLMKLSTASTVANTAATVANTTATNGATLATKALAMAQKLTPWGMVVGLIAGAVTALGIYTAATKDANKKTNENVEATEKLIDAHKELGETLQENETTRKDTIATAEEQAATADVLFNKLKELNEVEKKSNAQKETMKQLVSDLNEVMPDLNLKYNEEKDALNLSTEAIKKNIDAQKDLMIAKAAQSNLMPIAQDLAALEMENAELKEQYEKNKEAYEAKEKEQENNATKGNYSYALQREINALKRACDDSEAALKENEKQLEALNAEYDKTSAFSDKMFNKAEIQNKLNSLTSMCEKAGVKIPKAVSDGISKGSYALPQSVEEMKSLISFQSLEKKALDSGIEIPNSISKGIASGAIAPSEAVEKMNRLVSFSALLKKSKGAGAKVPSYISEQIINNKIAPQEAVKQMEALVQFNTLLEKSSSAGLRVPQTISDAISSAKALPKNAISEVNKLAIDEAMSMGGAMYKAGLNVVTGIFKGINDNKQIVFNSMGGLVDAIAGTFNKKAEVHSPSRLFARQSKFLPLGIAEGISKNTKPVLEALSNLINSAVNHTKTAGNDILGNIADGLRNKAKELQSLIDSRGFNKNTLQTKIASLQGGMNGSGAGFAYNSSHSASAGTQIYYNQYISSPKATDRMEIRRQTKNTLRMIGVKKNV